MLLVACCVRFLGRLRIPKQVPRDLDVGNCPAVSRGLAINLNDLFEQGGLSETQRTDGLSRSPGAEQTLPCNDFKNFTNVGLVERPLCGEGKEHNDEHAGRQGRPSAASGFQGVSLGQGDMPLPIFLYIPSRRGYHWLSGNRACT